MSSRMHSCVRDILARVDAPAGKAIHEEELADVVIVESRDGYKAVIELAGAISPYGVFDPTRTRAMRASAQRTFAES